MNLWTLAGSNLRRSPIRNSLTFVSLAIAFLLFMLLRAIAVAFSGGLAADDARLMVTAKYRSTYNLPLSMVAKIRELDGIDTVSPLDWFGAYYQDPKNTFAAYAVYPQAYLAIYDELRIDDGASTLFANTRIGALASRSLATTHGWSVGDRIPLKSSMWPTQDGTFDWEFVLCGIFDFPEDANDQPLFLLQYDYFNEHGGYNRDMLMSLIARATDPDRLSQVARALDALFEQSSFPTRTQSFDDRRRQYARRIGDVGLMTSMILGAVFFTLILLTGNVTAQAVRERIPELAVLKTLGFSDATVFRLVLTETCALSMFGAATGIVLALALQPVLNELLEDVVGRFDMQWQTALTGLAISALLGILVGLHPARTASRLSIVAALRDA